MDAVVAERVGNLMRGNPTWPRSHIGGVLANLTHLAYHLVRFGRCCGWRGAERGRRCFAVLKTRKRSVWVPTPT